MQNPSPLSATWNVVEPSDPYPIEQQGYIGCGFGRSNDTQLLNDISFMWMGTTSGSAVADFTLVSSADAFNGDQYQHVEFVSGTGRVGLANYGLDCQLGLYLVEGNSYSGFVYVRTNSLVTFTVSLEDDVTSDTLDFVSINANTNGAWQRFNFSLTPSSSTSCGATNQVANDFEQTIYSCSGRFVGIMWRQLMLQICACLGQ